MKISAKNTEVLLYVSLQTQDSVCGDTLQQVETFTYLGVVFMCDGRRSIRRLIHGLVKLTQFCVSFIALWAQNGEFSNAAKLSVFKSTFVPILTWSSILGNDRKNINSSASTKVVIFEKSPRCDKRAYRG